MPSLPVERLPKYRKHRASGQAVVTLSGRDIYLGPHGTKASRVNYDRITTEWIANGRNWGSESADITIVELLAAFRRHAVTHYRKDGKPTGEIHNFDCAIAPLRLLFGRERVVDFGPLKLKAVQAVMVKGYQDPKRGPVAGLSRGVVNSRIGRIKRIFRWAVSEEMAPPSLAHALDTVRGLQFGRCEAREMNPIVPVEDWVVDATLPYMPPVVADMVRLQRLTGCRPGEICLLRPCDVDRSAAIWIFSPTRHKTQHHGRDRWIFIGPKAQEFLRPYLLRESSIYSFQPAESENKRKNCMRATRKTAVPPSQLDRRKPHPKRTPGERYSRMSYARAVSRACDVADSLAHKADPSIPDDQRVVPRWTLNQLRHAAATEVRKRFGLEAAQVALGHARADTTQIYAARDLTLGFEVARQVG
jgi:integrase